MPASARAATSSLTVTISVGAAASRGDLDVRPRNGAGGFLGGLQPVEAERVDARTAGRAAGEADSGQSQACQEKKRTHVAPYAKQTDRTGRADPKLESLTGKYQQRLNQILNSGMAAPDRNGDRAPRRGGANWRKQGRSEAQAARPGRTRSHAPAAPGLFLRRLGTRCRSSIWRSSSGRTLSRAITICTIGSSSSSSSTVIVPSVIFRLLESNPSTS